MRQLLCDGVTPDITAHALQIFKEAQDLLPGGVNSPVRAFRSVGGSPIIFESVKVRRYFMACACVCCCSCVTAGCLHRVYCGCPLPCPLVAAM